jgi:hypothetical protein
VHATRLVAAEQEVLAGSSVTLTVFTGS